MVPFCHWNSVISNSLRNFGLVVDPRIYVVEGEPETVVAENALGVQRDVPVSQLASDARIQLTLMETVCPGRMQPCH
jgi:hypothetical protein